MKKILILLMFLILLLGCSKEKTLDDILKENNYIVVDVRTKEEFDSGHVLDAINIPYDEINKDINLDKDKTILVYCRSGQRSKIAYNSLKELGYDVYDLGAYDSINIRIILF